NGGPQPRLSSPPAGVSTFITRAPKSPSIIAARGPARARQRPRTRGPDNCPAAPDAVRCPEPPGRLGLCTRSETSAHIDDRGNGTAGFRALVRGRDGHNNCRVAGHRRGDTADGGLDLPVPVDVGVIEHRVAPPADVAFLARFAFEEDVHEPVVQV